MVDDARNNEEGIVKDGMSVDDDDNLMEDDDLEVADDLRRGP